MGEFYKGKSYFKKSECGKEYVLELSYNAGTNKKLVFDKEFNSTSGNGYHKLYFKTASSSGTVSPLERAYKLGKNRCDHSSQGANHKTYIYVDGGEKDSMETGNAGHHFDPNEKK